MKIVEVRNGMRVGWFYVGARGWRLLWNLGAYVLLWFWRVVWCGGVRGHDWSQYYPGVHECERCGRVRERGWWEE